MTEVFKVGNCTAYVTRPELTEAERKIAENRVKHALLEFGEAMQRKEKHGKRNKRL